MKNGSSILITIFLLFFCNLTCAQRGYISDLNDKALELIQKSDYEGAIKAAQESLNLSEKYYRDDPDEFILPLSIISNAYLSLENFNDAEPFIKRWLEISIKEYDSDDIEMAAPLNAMMTINIAKCNYDEAELQFKKLMFVKDLDGLGPMFQNLALLFESRGRYKFAEILYLKSKDIFEDEISSKKTRSFLGNLFGAVLATSLSVTTNSQVYYTPGTRPTFNYSPIINIKYNLMKLYIQLGRMPEAMMIAKKLIPSDLNFEDIIYIDDLYQSISNKTDDSINEAIIDALEDIRDRKEEAFGSNNAYVLYIDALIAKKEGDILKTQKLLDKYIDAKTKTFDSIIPEFMTEPLCVASCILLDLNQIDLAAKYTTRVLIMTEKNPDLTPPYPSSDKTLNGLRKLAAKYLALNKYVESEIIYQRLLTIVEEVEGEDSERLIELLNDFSNLYIQKGDYGIAQKMITTALSINDKYSDALKKRSNLLINLANIYLKRENYSAAKMCYNKALNIAEQDFDLFHPKVAEILNLLGSLNTQERDYTAAESNLNRAQKICERNLGINSAMLSEVLHNIGLLYYAQDKYRDAEISLLKALNIKEKTILDNNKSLIKILTDISNLYMKMENIQEANKYKERINNILKK